MRTTRSKEVAELLHLASACRLWRCQLAVLCGFTPQIRVRDGGQHHQLALLLEAARLQP